MVDLLGLQRTYDAEVIRDRADVRENVGEFHSGFAPLLELERAATCLEHRILELGDLFALGERLREGLAVEALEDRLVVKEFEVRRTSSHAKEDHALRFDG
jgi:hypothetical protein